MLRPPIRLLGLLGGALLAVPLAPGAAAQVKEDWRRPTFARRLALDSRNNVLADGFNPGSDFVADKFGADGTPLWSTAFGHPTINEHVNWLAVDSKDAVILTGHMAGGTGGLLTVKFGPGGAVLWSDVRNVGSGEAYRVEVDAADNVYVAGVTFDPHDNLDFYTVKYAPDGTLLWTRQKTFGPGSVDVPRALAVSPAGRVAVTGNVGSNDFGTVVYDAAGNELSSAVYLTGKSGPRDVLLAPDDTVYVCGMSNDSLGVVVRYDANGNQMWDAKIGGPGIWWARFNKLALDTAGNVIAAGYGNAPASSFMDWLVAKVDPQGNPLWTRTHGNYETWDEWVLAVSTGPADEVVVAGAAGVPSCSPGNIGIGTAVIRYDANGAIDWIHEAPCSAGAPNTILLDSTGEVVLDTGPGEIIRLVQEEWRTLGGALDGTPGTPSLDVQGYLEPGQTVGLTLGNALPSSHGWHVVGASRWDLPISGGTLIPAMDLLVPFQLDAAGQGSVSASLPPTIAGPFSLYVQSWIVDPGAAFGLAASNAVTKSVH